MTSDEGSLREMVKRVMQQMKNDFHKSVFHILDILEGRLFDKEQENEKLKKEKEGLTKVIEAQHSENSKLSRQIKKNAEATDEKINGLKQYGRRSNIRAAGLPESEGNKPAEVTTRFVIECLNWTIKYLNLRGEDTDIAHRLGKTKSKR